MKLYKHVSRFGFLKWVPRKLHPGLRWALGLKPGDMINDCSGFNVVIARADPEVYHTNKGWYIYDVIFTNEHGGCCSLRNCGVSPPLSVADIEKYKRQFYDCHKAGGGWHFKTDKDPVWVNLSSGKPICDELGRSIFRSKNE
jgi:hypothetical protein